jgi:APA family basic amino acid/polyamine antiporter
MVSPPTLDRSLSFSLVMLYGLGTLLGAGIYVLVGKVAGQAGMLAPVAFLLAAFVALFTGLSYSELVSRFPKAAGEAEYVRQAFSRRWLYGLVGWLVILTGVVSSATLANGFAGYVQLFMTLPEVIAIIGLVVGMGIIAASGMRVSAWMVACITLLEVCGLLFVLWVARESFLLLPGRMEHLLPSFESDWSGLWAGAFLAFYAYIGFEDMVNLAEEAECPERSVPRAIMVALLIATLLYMAVALVAVLALPLEVLSSSTTPLADIVANAGYDARSVIGVISLLAIMNGAMVQIIMGSRILYGLGQRGGAPRLFAVVHKVTRTPLVATCVMVVAVLIFALWLPLVTLAQITSLVILLVFALVNAALIRIKWVSSVTPAMRVPLWVPIMGMLTSLGLVLVQL